ncbi:sacsin N-terminal ATP-binding-like domain-containing protein [Nocardia sp. NPDC055053]
MGVEHSLEWTSNGPLAREVDILFESAIGSYEANRNLVDEHANHEDSIRSGGYSSRTLLELVQNAADAVRGTGGVATGSGRIDITLDENRGILYCANGGRPFTVEGLTAIAHAHLSAKHGDEIGRFGLGFKSVLAVTATPQVFSRSVSFEFNSEEARRRLAVVNPNAPRLPILRTATRVDADVAFMNDSVLADFSTWATTIVRLPSLTRMESLAKEIREFRSEFLLFVEDVREIRLRIISNDSEFSMIHRSVDLGNGRVRIEKGDRAVDWVVQHRMHAPSAPARSMVGEAVSRKQVKVTVAMPARQSERKVGQFWSYFPLADETTASGLFNAPWSVNNDRTNLQENDYNREILSTLAGMFVEMLPKVTSVSDPAAHLDYLPARGRELRSFGDRMLTNQIPWLIANANIVPNSDSKFCYAKDLRPLDFECVVAPGDRGGASVEDIKGWIESPNTLADVPHWRCYASAARLTRLRDIYVNAYSPQFSDGQRSDVAAARNSMAKRGILTWLREWADGPDVESAAKALDFVLQNPKIPSIRSAKVVPTSGGPRSLDDYKSVFLHRVDGIDMDGGVFVDPRFLGIHGVEDRLRAAKFRNLDPLAILRARLNSLSPQSDDSAHVDFWEAALDVTEAAARKIVERDTRGVLKVPTLDGGWSLPHRVLDFDGLGELAPDRQLDRRRCVPAVAHAAGAVAEVVAEYPIEDELRFDEYHEFVLNLVNQDRGPHESPTVRIEFDRGQGAGPFSVLLAMKDVGAATKLREAMTVRLLAAATDGVWTCEDLDTSRTYTVDSPARWAVLHAGVVSSTWGSRPPLGVVSPILVEYGTLLPQFKGARAVADALSLPQSIEDVPVGVLQEALEARQFSGNVSMARLAEFVIAAGTRAYQGKRPSSIPALVGRNIEPTPPESVFVATTEEQERFLSQRGKHFLFATEEQAEHLVHEVGCRRFEDSFSFSIEIDGVKGNDAVLDRFTGLRTTLARDRIENASVVTALTIAKLVSTEDGAEEQALDWHLDGVTLTVRADFDDSRVARIVNEAFGLNLTNAELEKALQAGIDQKLELQRAQARAVTTDSARLEIYFGDDTLREDLPTGLWHALQNQGLVDGTTSLGDLFLTVYRADAIRRLADRFREDGYTDVPKRWAGEGPAIAWVRKMGFGAEYAGTRSTPQADEFVVPGAVKLERLHNFQFDISRELRADLTNRKQNGNCLKSLIDLPTGAGKTRVATQTVLQLFIEGELQGPVLWIAQSAELCEQAVQTFSTVWRGLGDERPLTVGRLWEGNTVHQPDTEFSVIVATDAKLEVILDQPEYEWLSESTAVFVDEAHRAVGPRYTRILRWLGVDGHHWKRPLVGLSATPFRGRSDNTEKTRELASRFDSNIRQAFGGSSFVYEELVNLGVLARVAREVLPGIEVELNAAELSVVQSMRRLDARVLDRIGKNEQRMQALVDHILAQDPSWPILVFTPNVLSAQVLAATLRYRGVEAESVSGQTGMRARRDTIRRFKQGEIQVLTNCDLLIQGFDAPGVRALYIARPTFSPSAYIQMAGRGLRGPLNGGKEECLIVDVADNFGAANDFLGYREYEDMWRERNK